MNWKNLKDNKCPKCNIYLVERNGIFKCVSLTCDFFIGKEKFEGLVEKLYHPQKSVDARFGDIEQNLSALNNMGHNIVTEDFSDSPHLDY